MLNSTRGQFLRVTSFTSNGTWTKGNDVGMVHVQVIGGGGGSRSTVNGNSGGTSSFGSHCNSTGGSGGTATVGGVGGAGNSGDINLQGESGGNAFKYDLYSPGGVSFYGKYGVGGGSVSTASYYSEFSGSTVPAVPRSAGGGGGSSVKIINEAALGSSESITIGGGGSGAVAGFPGIVIVYEYSK